MPGAAGRAALAERAVRAASCAPRRAARAASGVGEVEGGAARHEVWLGGARQVASRQFPVTVHFNRRTPVFEYLTEALKKACKIHRRLPGGGILIFLTGRREIEWMCRRLTEDLARKRRRRRPAPQPRPGDGPLSAAARGGPGGPAAAGAEAEAEGAKDGFRFGEDDGADSDSGLAPADGGEPGPGTAADGDAGEGDSSDEEGGGEEGGEGDEAEEEEEEEEEDVAEEEYDLSESDASDGEEGDGEEGVEGKGGGEAPPRTVVLDADRLLGRPDAPGAPAGAGAAPADAGKGSKARPAVKRRPERVQVLPLYSMLPSDRQLQVFRRPRRGVRLIVVATNVAETSLTIPGIKYVIDTGRAKEKVYCPRTGISSFKIAWVSQAGANQRAGRAGRTAPGHCYRLYSSAVLEHHFERFSTPEILRSPIEGMVLQMKAMAIPDVRLFPYPTPPDEDDVDTAFKMLVRLGALTEEEESITSLGRHLAAFPIAPRFAKMLVLGHQVSLSGSLWTSLTDGRLLLYGAQGGCLPYVLSIVAALSVENPIVYDRADANNFSAGKADAGSDSDAESAAEDDDAEQGEQDKESKFQARLRESREATLSGKEFAPAKPTTDDGPKMVCRRDLWSHPESDVLAILKALGAYEFSGCKDSFAISHGLQPKIMKEMSQLRAQLAGLIKMYFPDLSESLGTVGCSKPPNAVQESLLRQIILAGLVDRVARKDPEQKGQRVRYQGLWNDEPLYIHMHSSLRDEAPEWVAYLELAESSRIYMKGITVISPSWLTRLAPAMCDRLQPMQEPPPRYDSKADDIICVIAPLFGPHSWALPPQTSSFPMGPERYKHFAKLLLEGRVISGFKAFSEWLTDRPTMLTRAWSQSKAALLLAALQHRQVASKASLQTIWAKEATYLLPEVLQWVRKEKHAAVRSVWPPSDAEPQTKDGKKAAPASASGAAAAERCDEFASGTDSGSSDGE